jgi:signal transduction histidine kinase
VALVTTAIVAVIYAVIASAALYLFVTTRYAQLDQQLGSDVQWTQQQAAAGRPVIELHGAVIAWYGTPSGEVRTTAGVPQDVSAPSVPSGAAPRTVKVAGEPFRVVRANVDDQGDWVVLATPVGPINDTTTTLAIVEAIVAPLLFGVVFFASWAIGRRAAAPVELARRRQLAFTADASHELRTPLQVIEAESSLALMRDRPAGQYRDTIERVSHESIRLRRIVDDLLWLARFEDQPEPPASEVVDLRDVADTALDRFHAVASRRGITLDLAPRATDALLVAAPPEWLERLAGVLVDNACRYAPDGGHVRLWAGLRSGRPALHVEDSGPGVPDDQVGRIFDRFHRASPKPGGAGLGLAIADSVVRATDGRWQIGRSSDLQGAVFEITWPLARPPRGEKSDRRAPDTLPVS